MIWIDRVVCARGKRSDGETYTIIKFKVEGAKHDGRVHVECKGGELNYLAIEVRV